MVHLVALSGGLEFDLRIRGLYCSVPFLGAVWLEVQAVRGGKFLTVERVSHGWALWAGRLHIIADRKPR